MTNMTGTFKAITAVLFILSCTQFTTASAGTNESVNRDFNGDGKTDLLVRNSTGGWYLYLLDGTTIIKQQSVSLTRDLNWLPASFADFNGDGKSDVLFRQRYSGHWWLYTLDGPNVQSSSAVSVTRDLAFQPVAFADTDNDGYTDIILRHTDGRWWRYGMSGSQVLSSNPIAATRDTTFEPAAFEDFNGDNKIDILLRNSVSGIWWLYQLNGADIVESGNVPATRDQSWGAVSFADFSGDGRADILLRNQSSSGWWLYQLAGSQIIESDRVGASSNKDWQMAATQDFDNDGAADLLLRSQTGAWWLYTLTGSNIQSQGRVALTSNTDWDGVSFSDFNADSRADVLVRNQSTGSWWLYLLDAQEVLSAGTVKATSKRNWQPQPTPYRVTAGHFSNQYTFEIENDPGTYVTENALMTTNAEAVIQYLSNYIEWKGTLDFVLRFTDSDRFGGGLGLLPSVGGRAEDGHTWSASEAFSGIDANGESADLGAWLAPNADGSLTNYGEPLSIDPAPDPYSDYTPPPGTHDFFSIYLHEVIHSMGVWSDAQYGDYPPTTFDTYMTVFSSHSEFTGAKVNQLIGQNLKFAVDTTNRDHYGATLAENQQQLDVTRGLMSEYGNYEQNRWHFGQLDLTILEDLGWTVANKSSLDLVEQPVGAPPRPD